METEKEIKVGKVVQEPKLSLKQFSAYNKATATGKETILKKCKYPGGYIPRFYEMGRKIICDTFGANFEDYAIYFDEFKRHAARLQREALAYPEKTDEHLNRVRSANGLLELIKMGKQVTPVLAKYILNSNLSKRRDAVAIEEVRIGAMADMLLFEHAGASQVGLLKFNFTKKPLSRLEAEYMLYVMRMFHHGRNDSIFELKDCMLIDVFSKKIYIATHDYYIQEPARLACLAIKARWPEI